MTDKTQLQVVENLGISKDMEKRLKDKLMERSEDLILDYLEQIEIHKQEIGRLTEKIKEITEVSYINADKKTDDEENI